MIHIFDRKEAARGSRAREVTCWIQKWNIKAEGFHPILVANARVDWLAMDDDDITKKFPILLEGILQDVFSQRAASAWQGAQPQKLTVSMLLPGTSSAAEWRDLLQSRRQFWPTLTTRHASLVPVSAEALQRERRQMQAKHLWYNVDIRWSDLKDKLEVLAPTGLTRDDIWRHLFLTKQRKNPYEEGCYTGEDLEDVKRKWEAKKEYFSQYKKDGCRPPCIDLIRHYKALTLTTLQRIRQLKTQKLYMHVDGRQKKECTVSRGRLCLMYVMHLSTMTMQLPLAQMSNRDGETGMETMLWDISVIPNGTGQEIPYAFSGSSTYECVGPLRTFHTFSPLVSPSKHLPCPCLLLLVPGVWVWLLLCRVFVSCFASVLESRILRAY